MSDREDPSPWPSIHGNLAVGNDRLVLVGTVTQLLPFIGYPRTLNALRVVQEGAPA